MKKRKYLYLIGFLLLVLSISISSCRRYQQVVTGWVIDSFDSNGERIYFTATSERDGSISYSGGPPTEWMMGGGSLTCASCHGPDAGGGVHTMPGMYTMDAPDIRWVELSGEAGEGHEGDEHMTGEYTLQTFRMAVAEGKHPDGDSLEKDMPRWKISDEDLADLADYLKTLN